MSAENNENLPDVTPEPERPPPSARTEPELGFLERLHHHRVAQWTLAYAAGAYTLLHAVEMISGAFGWSHLVVRLVALALLLGTPMVVTVAWFHGHRGRQRIGGYELLLVSALLAVSGGVLWLVGNPDNKQSAQQGQAGSSVADGVSEGMPGQRDGPSVAVLPIQLGSGEMAPFYRRISWELASTLERSSDVRLASTDAVDALPDNLSDNDAAERLGVRYLLKGSANQTNSGVALSISLFDRTVGKEAWTQQFDEPNSQATVSTMARAVLKQIHGSAASEPSVSVDSGVYELYLQAGQYAAIDEREKAEGLYRKALATDPGYSLALAGLCGLLTERYRSTHAQGHFEEAERLCYRAWTKDPGSLEVQYALGTLFAAAGEDEKAKDALEAALRINPHDVRARLALAGLLETEQPDLAEQEIKQVIKENPGSPNAYRELTLLYYVQGRYTEAVEAARWRVRLQPNSDRSKNSLASVLMLAGMFKEAKSLLLELRAEGSTNPLVENNLATILFFDGDYAEAADIYRRALESMPENYTLSRNLGDATWHAQGKQAAAPIFRRTVELADRALDVDPDSDALAHLCVALGSLGDRPRYEAVLNSLITKYRDDPQMQYTAAVAASRVGDMQTAADHARKALQQGYPLAYLTADPDIAAIGIQLDGPDSYSHLASGPR